jgi:hypothetical protein
VSANFDFSEVNVLAADLGQVAPKMIPLIRKAVEVTARNVKDDWKSNVPNISSRGSNRYKSAIDYEMVLDLDGSIGADVGPNLTRPGGSFGLLEDAPGGVTSAPQHSGRKAATKNESDFVNGLAKAAEDALK